MKLSVITINYNNAAGLRKTVESVRQQSYKDFEYIIIDGGSTDKSPEIIAETPATFACSEPDNGIYDAMNKGVRKASGDYILFLNSGDKFHSVDALQNISSQLDGTDIIYGNLRFCEIDGSTWIQTPPEKITVSYLLNHSLPHPATFIKRQLLVDDPYDLGYPIVADWVWFVKKILHEGCTYRHHDFLISDFMMGGVSNGNAKHDRERAKATAIMFPPIFMEVAAFERCGLKENVLRLSKTRKLHKRLRPLLNSIINLSLRIDGIFKHNRSGI